MTFEEWSATRQRADDMTDYGCEEGISGFVYASGIIMIVPEKDGDPEQYEVIIENWCNEISPDLAVIEKILWDNWAKDEVS